jgi:hypothetical protein
VVLVAVAEETEAIRAEDSAAAALAVSGVVEISVVAAQAPVGESSLARKDLI